MNIKIIFPFISAFYIKKYNQPIKMVQVKRSLALTAIAVMVSFIAFLIITKHSNIRAVEVLVTLALGMGISALIFNLAQLYKLKKRI